MDVDGARKLLEGFFSTGEEVRYKRRSTIIQIHERPQYAYWIKEGIVRSYSYSDEGDTMLHYLDKENELFPFYMLFGDVNQIKRQVGFSAFTDVVAKRRSFTDLQVFLNEKPKALVALLCQLSMVYDRIIVLNTNPGHKRLAQWLMMLAEWFGDTYRDRIEIDMSTTVQEFADAVRLSRESAGKILTSMEYQGAVIMGRQRIVIYPEKLQEYLT